MRVEPYIIKNKNNYTFKHWNSKRVPKKASKVLYYYSNKDLDKVRFIRDYYFENGKDLTDKFIESHKEYKSLNINNKSGETGVVYDNQLNKWKYVHRYKKSDGKSYQTIVGRFDTIEEAITCKQLVLKNGLEWFKNNKETFFPKKQRTNKHCSYKKLYEELKERVKELEKELNELKGV